VTARRESGERARVFVGLPLGEELGNQVGKRVAATLPRASWRLSPPAGLHATLVFLGGVERAGLEALRARLASGLARLAAPRLRLGTAGAFPAFSRPRVLWIGAEERDAAGRLEECRREVLAALAEFSEASRIELGEELTRPFRPHVTVARPRGARASVPQAFRTLALALDWDPAAVVLFESRPAEGGSQYVPLGTWPLAVNGETS
jgi:RNA 2',3'-cyclic 3'-phosphodiesterase